MSVIQSKLGLPSSASSATELEKIRSLLRRMADALESAAVFDRLHGVESEPRVEEACAFVAAEALALLSQMLPAPTVDVTADEAETGAYQGILPDAMQETATNVAIEAALLYLIGGYDINAVALVRDIPPVVQRPVQSVRDARLHNAEVLRQRLIDFCSGRVGTNLVGQSIPLQGGPAQLFTELTEEMRTWIYHHLASALVDFLAWLGGEAAGRREQARALVEKVRRATAPRGVFASIEFADMHHLASLLGAAFDQTATRSVAHVLPLPPTLDQEFLSQFRAYVIRRVRGTRDHGGRPFLWPSAMEYVQQCLPGPFRDSVIAMPTGSGKSFVAELGIVHALSSGGVLYLAPTNALVHQIRRDLEAALKPFSSVQVLAFIGSGEYTGLEEEGFGTAQGRFVAVMTPEKCALALRLNPNVLAGCSLCVFDECHLLNDEQRGITADVLMAQLFHLAPAMHFLLMSAMVSNPEQLADWLHTARNHDARPSVTKWRPTRTLRGMVVYDSDGWKAPFDIAKANLEQVRKASLAKKRPRKNMAFDTPLALLAGLSGPWTLDPSAQDYRLSLLGTSVEAEATATPMGIQANMPSWKNPVTRIFAEQLAVKGVPTIGFILSSRHHPFSLARQVTGEIPGRVGVGEELLPVVEAWLAIADAELGVQTELRPLLRRGVAVHTSAMLQVEQAAAERMFQKGFAKLMFATGTLAQGLNLPAVAVVVSGTTMGDPRDADKVPGLGSRVDAAILNAFGRAGRPSFSNQGIAVLVPDKPVGVAANNPSLPLGSLEASKVITQPDAGVVIGSPVTHFFDKMLASASPIHGATATELTLTAHLAEQPLDGDHAGEVLRRTFGGYLRRNLFTAEESLRIRDRLAVVKDQFLQQVGIPPWMNTAARQAGVDIFRASRVWAALQQHGFIEREAAETLDVVGWLGILFGVLRRLPPKYAEEYCADDTQKTPTVLTRLRDSAMPYLAVEDLPWSSPPEWTTHWLELQALAATYMAGGTYAELALAYYGPEKIPGPVPTDRVQANPIPGVFGFIREVIEPLARDAGCLVAVLEQAWKAQGATTPPQALQALPLCVRFGCDSLETLAWFRFGFRQRVSAHTLSKAFPLTANPASDAQHSAEVRRLRSRWLDGNIMPTIASALLGHVASVLREAGD
ncbi:MAG: DEAD/DEAH box helicase [Prosthecobacter sp.]|uniref:DEAD/DEAH box helicase n=1 Tax=Prosthecobacter sp. TaxID=1965333 RepID=UPI0038FEF7CC